MANYLLPVSRKHLFRFSFSPEAECLENPEETFSQYCMHFYGSVSGIS